MVAVIRHASARISKTSSGSARSRATDTHAVDWEAQPAEKVSGSLPSIASRSRWVDLIIAVLAAWLTQAKPRPRKVMDVQSL